MRSAVIPQMFAAIVLVVSATAAPSAPAVSHARTAHPTHAAPAAHEKAAASDEIVTFAPEGMKWGPAPAPPQFGIRTFVLEGNPSKPGPFTLRLWLPSSTSIGPYWAFSPERLTVMLGVVTLGSGDASGEASGTAIHAGGFALVPAKRHHMLSTRESAVVQIQGVGPWDPMYVNPTDDPRRAAAKAHN